jgi:hypothetical protein
VWSGALDRSPAGAARARGHWAEVRLHRSLADIVPSPAPVACANDASRFEPCCQRYTLQSVPLPLIPERPSQIAAVAVPYIPTGPRSGGEYRPTLAAHFAKCAAPGWQISADCWCNRSPPRLPQGFLAPQPTLSKVCTAVYARLLTRIAVLRGPIPGLRIPHFAKCGPAQLTAHQPEQRRPQDAVPRISDLGATLCIVWSSLYPYIAQEARPND